MTRFAALFLLLMAVLSGQALQPKVRADEGTALTAKQQATAIDTAKQTLKALKSGKALLSLLGNPRDGKATVAFGICSSDILQDRDVATATCDLETNEITLNLTVWSQSFRTLRKKGLSEEAALKHISLVLTPVLAHELEHFRHGSAARKLTKLNLNIPFVEDEALARWTDAQVTREMILAHGGEIVEVDEKLFQSRLHTLHIHLRDGIAGHLERAKTVLPKMRSMTSGNTEKMRAALLEEAQDDFKVLTEALVLVEKRDAALKKAKTAKERDKVKLNFPILPNAETLRVGSKRAADKVKLYGDKALFGSVVSYYKKEIDSLKKK